MGNSRRPCAGRRWIPVSSGREWGGRTCWCCVFEVVFVLRVHPARKALFLAVIHEMVLPTLLAHLLCGVRKIEGRTRLPGKARWGGYGRKMDGEIGGRLWWWCVWGGGGRIAT